MAVAGQQLARLRVNRLGAERRSPLWRCTPEIEEHGSDDKHQSNDHFACFHQPPRTRASQASAGPPQTARASRPAGTTTERDRCTGALYTRISRYSASMIVVSSGMAIWSMTAGRSLMPPVASRRAVVGRRENEIHRDGEPPLQMRHLVPAE